MKKFILIGMSLSMALFASAQGSFLHSKTNPTGTVTNTGTDTSSIALPGYYESINITLAVTKTSGTLAGTAVLQRSGNGVDWESQFGDTLTVTNVARIAKQIHLVKPDYIAYRILTTGSGTMVGTVVSTYAGKKQSF